MVYGEDPGSFDLKPAVWKPPATISPAMQREAVHAIGSLKARSAPVSQDAAEQWVAHFANLCAGKELPPETKLAGTVSAILLEGYPAALFDNPRDMLRIAKRFQWWPGWQELSKVLDEERAALRLRWERLSVIAKGGAVGPRKAEPEEEFTGPRTLDDATQAALDRLKATLSAAAPATHAPQRRAIREAAE